MESFSNGEELKKRICAKKDASKYLALRKIYDKDIYLIRNENHLYGKDIFSTEFIDTLKLTTKEVNEVINTGGVCKETKKSYCHVLLYNFLMFIFNKCINEKVMIKTPMNPNGIFVIEEMPKEWKTNILKRFKTAYKNVDTFESDFKFYTFVFHHTGNNQDYMIRVPKEIYNKLIDRVNEGERYLTDYAASGS